MDIGDGSPPEGHWAPTSGDIVRLKRCDFGGGFVTLDEPIEFVVYMVHRFERGAHTGHKSAVIRLMGRRLEEHDHPEPGVGALFVESPDDYEAMGKLEGRTGLLPKLGLK